MSRRSGVSVRFVLPLVLATICADSGMASATPLLRVHPTMAPAGTLIRVSASGFVAGEAVTLTLTRPDGSNVTSLLTADADGAFLRFFDSAGQRGGSYGLAAEGDEGSEPSPRSFFIGQSVVTREVHGFAGASLGEGWTFVDEDPDYWRLGEVEGVLRIVTQAGSLVGAGSDLHNLLLRPAPAGSFRVATRVEVHADQDFQAAGLVLYQDADHFVQLARGHVTGTGPGVFLTREEGESSTVVGLAEAKTVVELELAFADDGKVLGLSSTDGVLWQEVGRVTASFTPTQVGLGAGNGSAEFATEIPADFHWLRVDRVADGREPRHAHGPEGLLRVTEVGPWAGANGREWLELTNLGERPLRLSGARLANRDGAFYTVPAELPDLPPDAIVVVVLDGHGPAGNDLDLSDGVAVLHGPPGATAVLGDDADQVAVYAGDSQGPEGMLAFVAWGEAPMSRARAAEEAGLWRRGWFVPLALGTGWEGEEGPDLASWSLGLLPDAPRAWPRFWALTRPEAKTPGQANVVPPPPWTYPAAGTSVDGATLGVLWQLLRGAQGYRFQLDDEPTMGSPLVDEVVTEAAWRTDTPIPAGSYWWRVRALGPRGREGTWIEPVAINAFSRDEGQPKVAARELAVPWDHQRKDTALLCLDGDDRWSTDPWDAPHPTDAGYEHGSWNCVRASMAMINHYYGGTVSQDFLAYTELENSGYPFRYVYSDPPKPRSEWPEWVGTVENDLGHAYGSGPGSTELVAWAWGVEVAALDRYEGKPNFSWIRARIDDGRPIINVEGQHAVLIVGYEELGDGSKRVRLRDPADENRGWVDYSTYAVGILTAPPEGVTPQPVSDPPNISRDSDGDGIMDFDEEQRFLTDPSRADTDGDGVDDLSEVAATLFTNDGGHAGLSLALMDVDGDGLTMERDPDSDDDGFPDGCEDSNHNGLYEPELGESCAFSANTQEDCPRLEVQPAFLDFGWSASVRTIEVTNIGGSGLSWNVSGLPPCVSLDTELPGNVPEGRTSTVDLVLDRSLVGEGELITAFNVETEPNYGAQQVTVHLLNDSEPPVVSSVTPFDPDDIWLAGCPGPTSFLVAVEASDEGSGLDSVRLVLETEEGSHGSVPMTAVGDHFEATLDSLPEGRYRYSEEATDVAGNVGLWSTAPWEGWFSVSSCEPPQLGGVQAFPEELHQAPCDDGRLTVEATVRGADPDHVLLIYTVPGGSGGGWSGRSQPMTLSTADSCRATIGPFDQPGQVTWYVVATSPGGTSSESEPQSVAVLACTGPTITAIGADPDTAAVAPCLPDQVTLFAEVTDPGGWVGVQAAFRQPGGDLNVYMGMEERGDDRFETYLGPFPTAFTREFQIIASNQQGGVTTSDVGTLTVVECDPTPPQVSSRVDDEPLFLAACTPSQTVVRATVQSTHPVTGVELLSRYAEEAGWQVTDMTEGAAGEYSASLGPFTAPGTVQLWVRATASTGSTGSAQAMSVEVLPCQDGPEVEDVQVEWRTVSPAPCSPTATRVQAGVSDAPGRTVTEVRLLADHFGAVVEERTMSQVAAGLYEGSFPAEHPAGLYDLWVWARNDLGELASADAGSVVVAPCQVPAPVIEGLQVSATSLYEPPCSPDRVRVSAAVTAEAGVAEVNLRVRLRATAAPVWLSTPMELDEDGSWQGELVGPPVGAWQLAVEAVDNAGQATWSEPQAVVVRPCPVEGPDIALARVPESLSVPPCGTGRALVRAQVSDQAGVAAAWLTSRSPGGGWQVRAMTEDHSGEYHAVLGPFAEAGLAQLVVVARNSLGGWGVSEVERVLVRACHQPLVGPPTATPETAYLPPCEAGTVRVEAEVSDQGGVTGGLAAWWAPADPQATRGLAPLQKVPNSDRWGADIGPFERTGARSFALYVANDVGGGSWSEVSSFQVAGCSPPTVGAVSTSELPLYLAPCEPSRLTVFAPVSSDLGVAGAWAALHEVGSGSWRVTPMLESAQPGWYEAELPPFAAAGDYELVVGARSTAGGWAFGQPPLQVRVESCSTPSIGTPTLGATELSLEPCQPSTTVVTVAVSDPLGLAEVSLRYRNRSEEQWVVLPLVAAPPAGFYSGPLGPFTAVGRVDWQVTATNGVGAQSASPLATLRVAPCVSRASPMRGKAPGS